MEWQEVMPDKPVRQGDLLVLRHRHGEEQNDYALVLTADCDIAQHKHGTAYAAVRVLNIKRFIREEWASRHLHDCRHYDLDNLLNSFNKLAQKTLQRSSIENWIRRAPSDRIANELGITNLKEKTKFEKINRQLLALLPDESDTGSKPFQLLVQYLSAKENISEDQAEKKLLIIASKKLQQNLPIDIFFLSTIPDEAYAIKLSAFVLLRHLHAILIKDVTTSSDDAREHAKYLRIGRLSPTFKYAITQQFSTLYSRIGLPTEYDTTKATILLSLSAE